MTQPSLPLESAAPPRMEWSGRLHELLPVLTAEARAAGDGAWKWRQLSHGALVSLQLETDGRRLVRIARAEAPANQRARERWESELEIFARHLGTTSWQRRDDPEAKGAAALYLELWQGETAPGQAQCGRCQKPIPFDPVWGPAQKCDSCAVKDGDEETREILGRTTRTSTL